MAVAALVAGVACAPEPAAEAANATQTSAATVADTVAVLDAERAIWEAIQRRDWSATESATLGVTTNSPTGWADVEPGTWARMFGDSLVTKSYAWSSVRARVVTPDVVLLTYRATIDQTFGRQKTPGVQDYMSLWRRADGKWQAVAHVEFPVAPTPR